VLVLFFTLATQTTKYKKNHKMEDDRAQVDLGIAADIEETHVQQNVARQPKKRFVGKRTAAETAAAKSSSQASSSIEDSGAIQGTLLLEASFFPHRALGDGVGTCKSTEADLLSQLPSRGEPRGC